MAMEIAQGNGGPQNPIDIHVVPKPGVTLGTASFTLNGSEGDVLVNEDTGIGIATVSKPEPELLVDWDTEDWILAQDGLSTETVDDIVLIARYTVAAE
jgi:hypothetical protein